MRPCTAKPFILVDQARPPTSTSRREHPYRAFPFLLNTWPFGLPLSSRSSLCLSSARTPRAMNTSLNRLNAVSAMATTTLLVLLAIVAVLTHPVRREPTGSLSVHTLAVTKARAVWHADQRQQDFLQVQFDADLDLRPLFSRNTKQIFVSLAAEFASRRHNNTIVLWDRIVRRAEDAHVVLEDAGNKYPIREMSRSFE